MERTTGIEPAFSAWEDTRVGSPGRLERKMCPSLTEADQSLPRLGARGGPGWGTGTTRDSCGSECHLLARVSVTCVTHHECLRP